jgi:hypothetical protein
VTTSAGRVPRNSRPAPSSTPQRAGAVAARDGVAMPACQDSAGRGGGQPEHVVVEQRVAGLDREPAAAEGDDLPLPRHDRGP